MNIPTEHIQLRFGPIIHCSVLHKNEVKLMCDNHVRSFMVIAI